MTRRKILSGLGASIFMCGIGSAALGDNLNLGLPDITSNGLSLNYTVSGTPGTFGATGLLTVTPNAGISYLLNHTTSGSGNFSPMTLTFNLSGSQPVLQSTSLQNGFGSTSFGSSTVGFTSSSVAPNSLSFGGSGANGLIEFEMVEGAGGTFPTGTPFGVEIHTGVNIVGVGTDTFTGSLTSPFNSNDAVTDVATFAPLPRAAWSGTGLFAALGIWAAAHRTRRSRSSMVSK